MASLEIAVTLDFRVLRGWRMSTELPSCEVPRFRALRGARSRVCERLAALLPLFMPNDGVPSRPSSCAGVDPRTREASILLLPAWSGWNVRRQPLWGGSQKSGRRYCGTAVFGIRYSVFRYSVFGISVRTEFGIQYFSDKDHKSMIIGIPNHQHMGP